MWILPSVAQSIGPGGLLRVVGCLGATWCLLWFFVGKGTPSADHELPVAHHKSSHKLRPESNGRTTPWFRILTSIPIWAIIVNNFTFHYAVYVVMSWLPTYYNELLKVDLSSIGAIKSIPYIVMFLTSITGHPISPHAVSISEHTGGWLGDYFILKWRLSVASGRKMVNCLGFLSAAMSLSVMPYATSVMSGIFWTTMVMGALGLSRGGFSVNHMDIAPRFAGIVMGISNTAGTLAGVIGVAVTGAILESKGGSAFVEGWSNAFSLAALLGIGGSLFFLRSAKGERLFE